MELLKQKTLVYVEDEETIRNQITRFLKRRLGEVLTAEDGQQGLALIREANPDLVITDLEMPVMNGMEMIEQLRNDGNERPIVVVTAYRDREHYTDKADAYVYKPVMIQELLETLSSLVAR